MYVLWFRWWIPTLLHEDERKELNHYIKISQKMKYRSFWAEFSMHHPIQFLLYYFSVFLLQGFAKFLAVPIKMIGGFAKSPITKNGVDDVLLDEKLIEQDSNVPLNESGVER